MYHLQSISQMMNTPNNKKAKTTTTTISTTTTTPTSVITKIVTTKTTVQPQHNNKTNLFITRIRHNKRYSLARLKLHYHLYTETRYNENSPEFQT